MKIYGPLNPIMCPTWQLQCVSFTILTSEVKLSLFWGFVPPTHFQRQVGWWNWLSLFMRKIQLTHIAGQRRQWLLWFWVDNILVVLQAGFTQKSLIAFAALQSPFSRLIMAPLYMQVSEEAPLKSFEANWTERFLLQFIASKNLFCSGKKSFSCHATQAPSPLFEYFSHNSDWALGGKGIFIVPNIILQKCHKLEFPRRYFLKPHHSQPKIWKKTILKIINVVRLQIYKLIQSLYSVTCLTINFCQNIIFILLYQNQIFLTGQTLNHCHQQLYMLSHVVLNI